MGGRSLILALLLAIGLASFAAEPRLYAFLDNDTAYVPVLFTATCCGGTASDPGSGKPVTVRAGTVTTTLATVEHVDGVACAPARDIAHTLHANLTWDPWWQEVTIAPAGGAPTLTLPTRFGRGVWFLPLHAYAYSDWSARIQEALKAGAAVDAPDSGGLTPLVYAALRGREKAVETLLKAGASPHGAGAGVLQPLHYAAAYGQEATTLQLLQAGASVKDGDTYQPLHCAALGNQWGANPAPPGADEQTRQRRVADLLLSKGADITAHDRVSGWTPLHCAAVSGDEAVAALLIEKGADPGIEDQRGRTPLHLASARGRLEVVRLLLAKGADPTATDHAGATPAAAAKAAGYTDIVALLAAPPPPPSSAPTPDLPKGFTDGMADSKYYLMRLQQRGVDATKTDAGLSRLLAFLTAEGFPAEAAPRAITAQTLLETYIHRTPPAIPPLLYVSAGPAFALSGDEVAALREYQRGGGMVLVDSVPGGEARQNVDDTLAPVFPDLSLRLFSPTASVHRFLYRLPVPGTGTDVLARQNRGAFRGGRLAVFITQGNLAGLMAVHTPDEDPFILAQYQAMANVILYADRHGSNESLLPRPGADARITPAVLAMVSAL